LQFLVSRSKDYPNVFTLAEFYVDETALEIHRKTPHFILFQERVKEFGPIANKTPVLGEVVFPVSGRDIFQVARPSRIIPNG